MISGYKIKQDFETINKSLCEKQAKMQSQKTVSGRDHYSIILCFRVKTGCNSKQAFRKIKCDYLQVIEVMVAHLLLTHDCLLSGILTIDIRIYLRKSLYRS